jgi:HNH endonuclease
MIRQVLWKRLTETDFNAMNGNAAPSGSGGGAMHVALGVSTSAFPVNEFLDANGQQAINIKTEARVGKYATSKLSFLSNPKRRGGEWIIRSQNSGRHPAWDSVSGFPQNFDASNGVIILIFKLGVRFYARFKFETELASIKGISGFLQSGSKGIFNATQDLIDLCDIQISGPLQQYEDFKFDNLDFEPTSIEDARKRVIREIIQRQGQPIFRRKLLKAYGNRCTMTGFRSSFVLEAAHIVPYLGPKTNTIQNGLILRADIHTIFDLGLLGIHPNSRTLLVSSELAKSGYAKLNGRTLSEPIDSSCRPTKSALEFRFELFRH